MTSLFEAALGEAGVRIDVPIVEFGTRGCAIGWFSDDQRVLATVTAPSLPAELTRPRVGWDLDVRAIKAIDTTSGPRRVVIEHLPLGVPSVGAGAPVARDDGPPPFVAAVADRVAREHERNRIVGPLDPRLVFVDPRTSTFVATAQRPIRIGAVPAGEGDAPLFGIRSMTPNELLGKAATQADDTHRLAAIVWTWRHGSGPFSEVPEDAFIHLLAGVPNSDPSVRWPFDDPRDALDRLLASALRPGTDGAPTARTMTAAILSIGAGWRTDSDV